MTKLRVSIRDTAFGHAVFSGNPHPGFSEAKFLEWDRESPESAETVYTDRQIFGCPAGRRIWLIEPIHQRQDAWDFITKRAEDSTEVWTHDRQLLELLPNAKFVPLGGCWIKEQDRHIWPKNKWCSIITSNKNFFEGHALRHKAIELFPQIHAYGIEYVPLEYKLDGLKDYRFQLVFENLNFDYWFTEKLIDCFMTGTVPIYWGCPSISKFFNLDGILHVHNLAAAAEVLKYATSDLYYQMLPAIQDNFERAKKYVLAEDYMCTDGPLKAQYENALRSLL